MASDVDKDKGHSQYCLKLSVTPQGHPLQDFPEGYCLVRALYKAIRENDIIINHVSSILAEDGITLCHSNISINEYQSIIMQCDFHGRIEREKLNSVLSDGRLEGNLKAYIDGLKIKSTIGKQNIQIANLNVTILCAIVENTESVLENVEMSQSKKITTIPNYGTELLQTENLESEKEKEKETIEAVAESSCELDSRNEQLKADKLKLEKIEEADKPVTESSCEPDSRIEQLQVEKLNLEKEKETDKSVGESSCELFGRDEQLQAEKEMNTDNAEGEFSCELDSRSKQVPTEKIKSQKDQDTNKSVAESNYVLESSSQQLPADTKVNSEKDEKVAKTVTEHRNDSETSSEELQIKLKSEKEEKATNAEAESNYSSERRGEQVPTEKIKSQKEKDTNRSVAKSNCDSDSSSEQIPADTQVNSEKDEKVAKAVTVHSNDSETSSEEDYRKKNVRLYLDVEVKNVKKVLLVLQQGSYNFTNHTEGTKVWQVECSVPKHQYDMFAFSIEVTYTATSFYLYTGTKIAKASFSDCSKSQCVFIGLATKWKSLDIKTLCDMSVDIINNTAYHNLRSGLLQLKAMINKQEVQVYHCCKNSHGFVFEMGKTFQKCSPKTIEKVIKKINKSSKPLVAFCYFLFVVKAEVVLRNDSNILDNKTANMTIDACKCASKKDIPTEFIEPIITIVKFICTIIFKDIFSALLVIDLVSEFANNDILSKIIDDCQDNKGLFPLYRPTVRFDWKVLLLKMYRNNIELLNTIVQKLDRKMLLELLLTLYENGIKKNKVVQEFENHLDCLSWMDMKCFGQRKDLRSILSTWKSIAKCHFQRSKKFISETESAILSSVSIDVNKEDFELLLKVISDDNLFEGLTLQTNLIEILSKSKTAETTISIDLLIKLLNHDKITASGNDIFSSILRWFRNGLQISEKIKWDYKTINQTYLRLSNVLRTNYIREHDDVNYLLKKEVFNVIVQFNSSAIAKVLHEVDDLSDVRDLYVAHVRQMIQEGYFGNDVSTFMYDVCEKNLLKVEKR